MLNAMAQDGTEIRFICFPSSRNNKPSPSPSASLSLSLPRDLKQAALFRLLVVAPWPSSCAFRGVVVAMRTIKLFAHYHSLEPNSRCANTQLGCDGSSAQARALRSECQARIVCLHCNCLLARRLRRRTILCAGSSSDCSSDQIVSATHCKRAPPGQPPNGLASRRTDKTSSSKASWQNIYASRCRASRRHLRRRLEEDLFRSACRRL